MNDNPKSDNQTKRAEAAYQTVIEAAALSGWTFAGVLFVQKGSGDIGVSFTATVPDAMREELVERMNLAGELEKLLQ